MPSEADIDQTVKQLKEQLAKQDELKIRFEAAHPADYLKDEIDLGDQYQPVTEFRMEQNFFLVSHTPTQILNEWSILNGPKALKRSVEKWVDQIHRTYPPPTS